MATYRRAQHKGPGISYLTNSQASLHDTGNIRMVDPLKAREFIKDHQRDIETQKQAQAIKIKELSVADSSTHSNYQEYSGQKNRNVLRRGTFRY